MSSHRQRLIDEAERLFHESGFHAVSLDTILRAAATTKTTFYKHFESKDELALICLRNCRERWWQRFEDRRNEESAVDPIDQIRLFFRLLGERFESGEHRIIPSFAACGEFPHPTDPRNLAGRESLREIESRLRQWAEEAGATDAQRLASQLAVTAKGSILHELAHGEGRSGAIATEMAECLLDQHFETTGV